MSHFHHALIGDSWGRRRQRFGLFVAVGVAVVLLSQAFALHDVTSAQEATCPGGSTPQPDYGGQLVCPETGTVTAGEIPNVGFGLIVFGGGTTSELTAASGCPLTVLFWTLHEGQFIILIPSTLVSSVNDAWFDLFGSSVPPNTPLIASCGRLLPAPSLAPAAPRAPAAPSATRTVIVQPGDTLIGIAAGVGVDWLALAGLNGIAGPDYIIFAGQTLVLPAGPK